MNFDGNLDDYDGEEVNNAAYKLFANSKSDVFSAWLDTRSDGAAIKDEALKNWITVRKFPLKTKTASTTSGCTFLG